MKHELSWRDIAQAKTFGHFPRFQAEPKKDNAWMFVLFVIVTLTLFFVL